MSDTPRTDRAELRVGLPDFAKTLEREVAALKAEVAASHMREISITDDLEDIALMPEYDQDDAHRLREKAKVAIAKWGRSV